MDPIFVVGLAVAAITLTALYVAARRAVTVAELEITSGVVKVVRGGIAPPILADLRDIARKPAIRDLKIRITRASGRAEVTVASGTVSEEQAQRIRNVIGSVPLARLMNAPKKR